MKPKEAYDLLVDVRQDYVAMVNDLNKARRRLRPVDPRKLPLVVRMDKAIIELGQQ